MTRGDLSVLGDEREERTGDKGGEDGTNGQEKRK